MTQGPDIRESKPQDTRWIDSLYLTAFPDEELVPLVRALLKQPNDVVSLVKGADTRIVGHVILTLCGVDGNDARVALLGPLAVHPEWQGQGIGSEIVRYGLRLSDNMGVRTVCVLGDPNYYGRLGFVSERSIEPPYPLPPEWEGAWQSVTLSKGKEQPAGLLSVPRPWRRQALWAP